MMGRAVTRRLLTIPAVYVLLAALTVSLPVILLLAAVVDLTRRLASGRPAMSIRLLVFAWLYLVGEAWAILALAALGLLRHDAKIRATYRAQRAWLDWNFDALRLAFSLRFEVEGEGNVTPGPIILLSNHASLIDTMLPGRFVVRPHGIKLRYVLKRELLIDPALDIGAHRLPNYFIDRKGDPAVELAALRGLATSLAPDEGVLIYPEGTRFSEAKRVEYVKRWRRRGGAAGEIAAGFQRVLPPRPAGTLEILDASDADVVILAHRGLAGFARVGDLWGGGLVGSVIGLHFVRVPRSQIPTTEDERTTWLFSRWAEVDAWVQAAGGPLAGRR